MSDKLTTLANVGALPGPLKAGVGIAAGAGLAGYVYAFSQFEQLRPVLIIVAAGAALLLIILAAFKFLAKVRSKGKGVPFAKALTRLSSPGAVADPAQKARLDDLRKRFEEGTEKFRANGKDIYSLPWYIIAGPPASGKTEAIRHSGVGFPPGLQDFLQGTGGTLNMNWWFTNHAVILDTAGRMFMEEKAEGGSSEWKEFLKMLKTARPNCPINGLLLCISVDTLVKDTAEQIEQKAGVIARQLDVIQRTLDVRFPVFVIVTKCDLLNGWREFFDGIDDPQLQHQMLGWSNPSPLDSRFEPEKVADHLNDVRRRLLKRRLGLLQDPVNTEDQNARRTDQVDALFTLPESLSKVAPRLRRYLELIFVAGEWSPKPLFLRGIYFTTSMRDGAELDADLADALGVSVDSIPGGKIWDREKSYFLRDTFMAKVFRERGLVTRATNVAKAQRGRRLAVLGAGFVTVLALLGFMIFGNMQFQKTVGKATQAWSNLGSSLNTLQREGKLDSARAIAFNAAANQAVETDSKIPIGGEDVPVRDVLATMQSAATDRIEIPAVFRLLAGGGNLKAKERLESQRLFVDHAVLDPLVGAARGRLASSGAPDVRSASALAELIRLEVYAESQRTKNDKLLPLVHQDAKALQPTNADALALVAVDQAAVAKWGGVDKDGTWARLSVEKSIPAGSEIAWPPASLNAGTETARGAINRALTATDEAYTRLLSAEGSDLGKLSLLSASLAEFRAKEDALRSSSWVNTPPTTVAAFNTSKPDAWTKPFGELKASWEKVDATLASLSNDPASLDRESLAKRTQDAGDALKKQAADSFSLLRKQLPPEGAADAKPVDTEYIADLRSRLSKMEAEIRRRIEERVASLTNELKPLSDQLLARSRATEPELSGKRAYQLRAEMWTRADERLNAPAPEVSKDAAAFAAAITNAKGEIDGDIDTFLKLRAGELQKINAAADDTRSASEKALRLARAKRMNELVGTIVAGAPRDASGVAEAVKAVAGGLEAQRTFTIPMAEAKTFLPEYHPQAAGQMLGAWRAVEQVFAGENPEVLDAAELRQKFAGASGAYTDYAKAYLQYWSVDTAQNAKVRRFGGNAPWSDFLAAVQGLQAVAVNGDLSRLAKHRAEALSAIAEVGAVKPDVTREKKKLEDEAALVESSAFTTRCGDMRTAWANLSTDAVIAQRDVIAAASAGFDQSFGRAYQTPGVLFWNSMVEEGLRLLTDEFRVKALESLQRLRATLGFPALRDAERVMSASDIRQAKADIDRVRSAARAAAAGPALVMNGVPGELQPIIRQLRGDQNDQGLEAKLNKVTRILDVLGDEAGIKGSLVPSWERSSAEATATVNRFQEMRMTLAGNPPRVSTFNASRVDDVFLRQREVTIPGDAPIAVRFFQGVQKNVNQPIADDEPASAEVVLPAPWGPLEAILRNGGEPVQGNPKRWFVPLTFNQGGVGFKYWLELVLREKELPALRDWPTKADMP
jgi:hypothetical protein